MNKHTPPPHRHPRSRRALAAALALLQALPASLLSVAPQLARAQQTVATEYQYDAQGNLTKVIDPNLKATDITPDALNRVQKQTLPAPAASASRPEISYTYDGQNRLLSVKDPRGATTWYGYSGLEDLTQVSPDTGILSRYHDEAGNLYYSSNARGDGQERPWYDALNRPVSVNYYAGDGSQSGGSHLDYDEYSTTPGSENYGRGYLTRATDFDGTGATLNSVSLRYDQLGRLTRRCQFWQGLSTGSASACADSDALSYSWGAAASSDAGRLVKLTYPSARVVNYQYDALGRISGITTAANSGATVQSVISGVTYKPLGIEASEHAPTGWTFGAPGSTPLQKVIKGYGNSGWPTGFTIGSGAIGVSALQANHIITSDTAGRIKTIRGYTTTTATNTYTYDDLNRLTQASLPGGVVYNYGYDLNGNRTLKTSASLTTYTYPATSNKLTGVKVGAGAVQTVAADAAGNITQDPATAVGAVSYTYDSRTNLPYGRLIKSQGPGAQWSYAHNFFGQRIRKSGASYTPPGGSAIAPAPYIGSTDTLFHYDMAGHLIAELDATSKRVKREYIWMADTLVAIVAGSTPTAQISATNAPALYYVHSDHLGTPRMVTDTAGNRRWEWSILSAEPFGASAPNEGPAAQAAAQLFTLNLRFPGQYLDKESGSFYNYFRTYNPSTGRYLQSDPIGLAGGLNTYGYVSGNPLSLVDPLGLAGGTGGGNHAPPDVSPCIYYQNVCKQSGCKYHCNAYDICMGNPTVDSVGANGLLEACLVTPTKKNQLRKCLVREDAKARANPSCQKNTCNESGDGKCTKKSCIDDYHNKCFNEGGIGGNVPGYGNACYGGNTGYKYQNDGD